MNANAASGFIIVCVILAVEDMTLPTYIRLLAGGIFGFPAEDPKNFYQRYSVRRKTRAPIALLLAIGMGAIRWFSAPAAFQAIALGVAVSGYGGLVIYDMFRSRPTASNQ